MLCFFLFQAEDGIRGLVRSRGLGDVYKRQEQWNAWVRQNFGEDPNLLMQKMTGPVDLTKPYILANNTSSGIVHKIDGMDEMNRGSYTTNDVNLLPKGVDPSKLIPNDPWVRQYGGEEYLGGI